MQRVWDVTYDFQKLRWFLIAHVAAKVAQKTEQNIWNGSTNAGEFDGFKTLLLADSDVVDVSGTTLSKSNIITELDKVVDAIPSAVYGKRFKIYFQVLLSSMFKNKQS